MKVTLTLEQLAQKVNCAKFPARWNAFYEEVMEDYEKNGCRYLAPSYFQELNETYGILTPYLSLYQKAAQEIAKDEALSRFFAVLCRGLQDRDCHKEDMRSFSAPKKEGDFAYEMLTALAIASEAELCYELLQRRKLPKEFIDQVMHFPEGGIEFFRKRNDGRDGYCLLDWFQLAIDGKLYRIGRLEFEIFHRFEGPIRVFRNAKGEEVALADGLTLHRSGMALGATNYQDDQGAWTASITEEEDAWIGYPVEERGSVLPESLRLEKALWKQVLAKGDPAVSVHIPAGGGLTPKLVDESIAAAKEFFATYFPDYEYKAFVCYSWMMDPQLLDLLGEDTNISLFNRRFRKLTAKSDGSGVFSFIFLKPYKSFPISMLPENTTLEKALKQHYLDGKVIYSYTGYFFDPDDRTNSK